MAALGFYQHRWAELCPEPASQIALLEPSAQMQVWLLFNMSSPASYGIYGQLGFACAWRTQFLGQRPAESGRLVSHRDWQLSERHPRDGRLSKISFARPLSENLWRKSRGGRPSQHLWRCCGR